MNLDVSIGAALLAGIISFLSPCVLPLVPPYLCFITGASLDQLSRSDGAVAVQRRQTMLAALMFVLGFATVFILLRMDVAQIGQAVSASLGPAGVDPTANPRFGWTFVVWILLSTIAGGALWQPGTSKALASASPTVAKRVFFWTGMTFAGRAIIPIFWGAAALAYFGPGQASAAAMPRIVAAW